MATPPRPALTISTLAERTGVPAATLRSWESRYGFPRPSRLAGGHRRYAEGDVDAVLEVLRHRRAGLALEVAVRRVAGHAPRSRSVFAELRRHHPELAPQVVSKSSLVAISRAIEDECCAHAAEPLLFGAFQRTEFLATSYRRWEELARTARAAVVFADLDRPAPVRPGRPVEVAIPPDAPLGREWLVICDAPDLPVCMAAVEPPGQPAELGSRRRFEMLWTMDPSAVRHASRVAATLADELRPDWRTTELTMLDEDPPSASADLRRASALMQRMLGYLDARSWAGRPDPGPP